MSAQVSEESRARREARAKRPTNQPTVVPTAVPTMAETAEPTEASTDQPTDDAGRASTRRDDPTLPALSGVPAVPARDDDPVHPDDGPPEPGEVEVPATPAAPIDDALAAGQAIALARAVRPRGHGHGTLDVPAFDKVVDGVAGRPRGRGGVTPVNVAVSALLADRLDAYVSAHRVATGSRLSKREVVEALLDELLGDPR